MRYAWKWVFIGVGASFFYQGDYLVGLGIIAVGALVQGVSEGLSGGRRP